MAEKTKRYGIAVIHPDGVIGWIVNPQTLKALLFRSAVAANRAIEDLKQDKRYSWTLQMESRLFEETTDENEVHSLS